MERFNAFSSFTIEFLNVLAWPIIALICIIVLKKPISDLIARIKQFDYGTNSVKFGQQEPSLNKSEELLKSDSLKLFKEETDKIAENIIESSIHYNDLGNNEKITKLYDLSKFYIITSRFEFIYNLIMGSQIRIIQELNTVTSARKEYIKKFYDYVAVRNKDIFDSYDFDSYLNFLFYYNLIKPVEDNKIQLTGFGEDFYTFLVQTKKILQKPY